MKKRMLTLLIGCILLFLFACSSKPSNQVAAISGKITTYGGNPLFLGVETNDGKTYGFVVNDGTELIWKDESALSKHSEGTNEWDVLGCNMEVDVVPGEDCEPAKENLNVDSWRYAEKITVNKVLHNEEFISAKPVIYLYPKTKTDVTVHLNFNGLTCTYPEYNADKGWQVTAYPDGHLVDNSGMEYNYLYWEGKSHSDYDFSKGFCVKGKDTASFLENALSSLGLTRREANEFIVYWLPQMQDNAYNLISFQQEKYTDNAELIIDPMPDTVIRVFMAWKPLDTPVEVPEQEFAFVPRDGFTVIEWGGCKVDYE